MVNLAAHIWVYKRAQFILRPIVVDLESAAAKDRQEIIAAIEQRKTALYQQLLGKEKCEQILHDDERLWQLQKVIADKTESVEGYLKSEDYEKDTIQLNTEDQAYKQVCANVINKPKEQPAPIDIAKQRKKQQIWQWAKLGFGALQLGTAYLQKTSGLSDSGPESSSARLGKPTNLEELRQETAMRQMITEARQAAEIAMDFLEQKEKLSAALVEVKSAPKAKPLANARYISNAQQTRTKKSQPNPLEYSEKLPQLGYTDAAGNFISAIFSSEVIQQAPKQIIVAEQSSGDPVIAIENSLKNFIAPMDADDRYAGATVYDMSYNTIRHHNKILDDLLLEPDLYIMSSKPDNKIVTDLLKSNPNAAYIIVGNVIYAIKNKTLKKIGDGAWLKEITGNAKPSNSVPLRFSDHPEIEGIIESNARMDDTLSTCQYYRDMCICPHTSVTRKLLKKQLAFIDKIEQRFALSPTKKIKYSEDELKQLNDMFFDDHDSSVLEIIGSAQEQARLKKLTHLMLENEVGFKRVASMVIMHAIRPKDFFRVIIKTTTIIEDATLGSYRSGNTVSIDVFSDASVEEHELAHIFHDGINGLVHRDFAQ